MGRQSKLSIALVLSLTLTAILLGTTGSTGQESERGKCEKRCEAEYQTCRNAPNANQASCKSAFDACRAGCKNVSPQPSPTGSPGPESERGKCEQKCEQDYQACRKDTNANQATCKTAYDACRAGCKEVRPHPSPTESPAPEGTPSGTPSPTPMEPTPTPSPGRSRQ